MKAKDLIQLFEYGKAFKSPKASRSRRKIDPENFALSDIDVSMMLHKKLQEADTLRKLLKDHERANKEHKEEVKNTWSLHHISYFLIATFPITAPLYVAYLRHMLG